VRRRGDLLLNDKEFTPPCRRHFIPPWKSGYRLELAPQRCGEDDSPDVPVF